MGIDYAEWDRVDKEKGSQNFLKYIEEIASGRKVTQTSLFPELGLKPEDVYTLWRLPGSPDGKQRNPTTNIANLVTHYDKIIIPIYLYQSKQDFEYGYAMSLENLIWQLKDNADKYVPVLTEAPWRYRAPGFYDELFETCSTLYDDYPAFIGVRIDFLQNQSILAAKAVVKGIQPTSSEEALQIFPELDLKRILEEEIGQLTDRDVSELLNLSHALGVRTEDAKRSLAVYVWQLRSYGHEDLVSFILNDFHEGYRNLAIVYHVLARYSDFLVCPIDAYLGGFANYTTLDLENMAFLRVLPLMRKDIKELDKVNFRLLLNSPGARSPVNLESYKMKIFLKGGDDINTLNELSEFAERHKKEIKAMSEYRRLIASGDLSGATEAFRRASEIYTQIDEEAQYLASKEKTVKLTAYSISGGAIILSDIALFLQQGLPQEWKLVIALFKDTLNFLGLKDLDAKRMVEWVYELRTYPWYEKGVPYLYWRAG